MSQDTPLPENLKTALEADVYRAIKAVQDSSPEILFSEIEKQVYNAILAAGGMGGGGEGSCTSNYSLDEQVIGTWIDNKPIYRKGFQNAAYATNGTFSSPIDCSSLNISEVVSIKYTRITGNTIVGSSVTTYVYYNKATKQLQSALNPASSSVAAGHYPVIFIEYTKTTD